MISYIIPTLNESDYLGECLESIRSQEEIEEIIVVDGGSQDGTVEIAEKKADRVVREIDGRGMARKKGAEKAKGEYYAFLDADTVVRADYSGKMIDFVERRNLAAASSKFEMTGFRSKLVETFGNQLFHRRNPVLLPGFNIFVDSGAYQVSEGFEDILGEDLQFSERIAEVGETDIIREKLVTTSGRRIAKYGLTGVLIYYSAKEVLRRYENSRFRS